ncbi:hypothetical protein Slin14017_G015420 [Septoria linicola]|nr:hypothetical protein Slin14017_G015420 [Septoria linicola]
MTSSANRVQDWCESAVLAGVSAVSGWASDGKRLLPSYFAQATRYAGFAADTSRLSTLPTSVSEHHTITGTITTTTSLTPFLGPTQASSMAAGSNQDSQLSFQRIVAALLFRLLPAIALLGVLCFIIWQLYKIQRSLVKSQHRTSARIVESSQTILDQLVLATVHRLHEVRGREARDFTNAPRIELLEGVTATVKGLADIFLAAEHQELLLRIDALESENDRLKREYESPRSFVAGAQIIDPISEVNPVQTYDGSPTDTDSPQRLPPVQSAESRVSFQAKQSVQKTPLHDSSVAAGSGASGLLPHQEVNPNFSRPTTAAAKKGPYEWSSSDDRRDQESPTRKQGNSPPSSPRVPSVVPVRSKRASLPNVHAPAFQPAVTAKEAPTSGRSSANRVDRPRNRIPDPAAPVFEPAHSPISKVSSAVPSQLGETSATGCPTQASAAKSLKATVDSEQPGDQVGAGERVTRGGPAGTEQGRGPGIDVSLAAQTAAEAPAYERDIFRKQRENARRLFGPKSQAPSAPN